MGQLDHLALGLLHRLGFASRYIPVPLGKIHFLETRGQGTLPPLMFFHGLGSCSVDYMPLLLAFRKLCRAVYAVDFPGHGQSRVQRGTMEPALIEQTLIAATDQLPAREPCVVFGNSLGGITAIRYTLLRPQAVRALVLASPAGAPMDAATLARFLESLTVRSHATAVDFVDRFLPKPGLMRHPIAWGIHQRFRRWPVREFLGRIQPEDLLREGELQQIGVPSVVFWGDQDRILPVESREYYAENMPARGKFELLRGVGHAPYIDEPRGFVERMEGWMRKVA